MKVLITLPVKIGFDGMTRQVLSYCKYMDKTDIEIDLVSCRGFDPQMKDQVEEAQFSHIYRLEYRDTNQLKYFFNLVKLMKSQHYDVIHANGQSATLAVEMLAGMLSGCKLRIAHSHNSRCLHKKAHMLLKPLFKVTYNDAIACSKEAGKWLFEGRPFWLLNNGVDIDKFKFNQNVRNEYRNVLELKKHEIAVGHVGAFEPWKNHGFLLDVFCELKKTNPEYKLFLFGIDGTTRQDILNKIEEQNLGDNVIYKATSDVIQNYMQAMDLMVLPSWYEGFPVTVVEWQANGLPCLVSDTITKDARITKLVYPLSISDGVMPWVNAIKEYGNTLHNRCNSLYPGQLVEAGFDIKVNANELKKHYQIKLQRR